MSVMRARRSRWWTRDVRWLAWSASLSGWAEIVHLLVTGAL